MRGMEGRQRPVRSAARRAAQNPCCKRREERASGSVVFRACFLDERHDIGVGGGESPRCPLQAIIGRTDKRR